MEDLKDFVRFICTACLMIMFVFVVGFIIFLGFGWIVSGLEYKTWNKLNGTNYTHYDWWTGSDYIQKYHYPDRDKTDKKEINVNLNQ